MKRIIFLSAVLIIITGSLYWIKQDKAFCAFFFFTGFLAIFCYSVNVSYNNLLCLPTLDTKLKSQGEKHITEVLKGYSPSSVSDLEQFTPIKRYFESSTRQHDSEEYLEDMSKSLFFASIGYIFGTIMFIISFMEKPATITPELAASKSVSVYLYLMLLSGYTFWYTSPIMLFKKKNKMITKHEH